MSANARVMNLGEYFGDAVRHRQAFGLTFTENKFQSDLIIPRHQHALNHLTCVLEGGFTEEYEGIKLDCQAGSMLMVPQGRIHEDRIGPQGAHTLSVEVSPKTMQRIADSTQLFSEPTVLAHSQITRQIERLYHEFHARDDASLLAIASITLELIVIAERAAVQQEANAKNWMEALIEELHRDPTAHASLGSLAQKYGIHEAHMARAFRRRHGSSIGEYVRWLRLERSKHSLAHSTVSISAIAIESGFYDQAHFSRAFKKQYGVSPITYRKQWGGGSPGT